MVFWLVRVSFSLLVTFALVAIVVTFPVGRRTLFEHAVAIFSTEPARELGEDLVETGRDLGSRVQQAFEQTSQATPGNPTHTP